LRRAAGDKLHDPILRRNGNHVGDIPPGTVEQTGRDVVFLPDRADLAPVFEAQMPQDLDILLARSRLGDGDIGVEDKIGLGLRIRGDNEILLFQELGNCLGQRLSAVARGACDAADLESGASTDLGLSRGVVLQQGGERSCSNVPIEGVAPLPSGTAAGHSLIDLGADEYTLGRPHAIIDPAMRSPHLARALADPSAAVVLLDVVLGYGAHRDPASFIADAVAASPADRPVVVASVCGTVGDPQGYEAQCAKLKAAGILLASSNAAAAERALAIVRRR